MRRTGFGAKHINLGYGCLQAGSEITAASGSTISLHKGFIKRWIDTSDDAFLEALSKELGGAQQVVFTGHSLGGAIAILATLWYMQQAPPRYGPAPPSHLPPPSSAWATRPHLPLHYTLRPSCTWTSQPHRASAYI